MPLSELSINLANPFRIIFIHKNNSTNYKKNETFKNYEEQVVKLRSPECVNYRFCLTNIINSKVE